MAFIAKLDRSERLDERAVRRWVVRANGSLRFGARRSIDVIVHDLSERGFLAEFASDLAVGEEVRLRLGRGGYMPARIVWKRGLGHGCAFTVPVSAERIAAAHAGAIALYATDDGTPAAMLPGGWPLGAALLGIVGLAATALLLWLR